jgi:hypothetical protein
MDSDAQKQQLFWNSDSEMSKRRARARGWYHSSWSDSESGTVSHCHESVSTVRVTAHGRRRPPGTRRHWQGASESQWPPRPGLTRPAAARGPVR